MTRLIKNGHLARFGRPASLGRTKARRNGFDSNRLDVPSIPSFAAVHKKGAFVLCLFELASVPARSRCFDFSTLSYFCCSRPPPVRFLINSRSRRELPVRPTNPISFKSEIIYIFSSEFRSFTDGSPTCIHSLPAETRSFSSRFSLHF
jgi:hypothetical protein